MGFAVSMLNASTQTVVVVVVRIQQMYAAANADIAAAGSVQRAPGHHSCAVTLFESAQF